MHRFLIDLVGGRTLVLLGSRSSEEWIAKQTFAENVYDLGGLDPQAASVLTDRILEKHCAKSYRQDEDLSHLITLLDGFPLALEVVLAKLWLIRICRALPLDRTASMVSRLLSLYSSLKIRLNC